MPRAVPIAALPDAMGLWALWRSEPSQALRDTLVARYRELVRIVAATAYRHRYSEELEFDDYLQFGMVGLLESIDRYEPDEGYKFETFASHRIHGAIMSGVTCLSEKQQQITARRRVRTDRARSLLHAGEDGERNVRAKTEALQQLADVAVGLALGFMLEEGSACYRDSEPASGNTPYEQVEFAQLSRRMLALVDQLPDRERRVIRSHYLQQQTFDDIALACGLTKGRISQIHHAALRRLREMNEVVRGLSLST